MALGRAALAMAAVAIAVAVYAATTDPLHVGITAGFPSFEAHYVEQPAAAQIEFRGDEGNRLAAAEVRFEDEIGGPESIAFDSQGRGPYTGLSDGRIVRWDGPSKGWSLFATTSPNRTEACEPSVPPAPNYKYEHICGRPLGLRFHPSTGELYIADAYMGLLVVGPDGGAATPLVTQAEGQPLVFTNDLDFGDDGCIYFTDSSTKYQRRNFLLSILEGDVTGRLLKYDPSTKQASVLLGGLRFPNGCSMSKDRSFLVFAETITGKLSRYWLKGPKAGTSELFVTLPGHPDNVRTNSKGEFWVAIHGKRMPIMRFLGPRPWLRELILRLPIPARYVYRMAAGKPYALLLKYDEHGRLLDVLEDQDGKTVSKISEAEEHDGKLWLGTVLSNKMWVYQL